MKREYRSTLLITIVLLLFSGCGLNTSGLGPAIYNPDNRTFIDSPLDETEWQAHRPIAISVHANFNVTRILVDVTKIFPSDPSFRETLEGGIDEITPGIYQANLYWIPPAAGRYRLMAYSFTGSRINGWDSWTTHSIELNIIDERGGGEEPIPTPLSTTPTVENSPAPWIDLWADAYTLTSGACTTLRWDSLHVDQLLLDGEAVAFAGNRQICPGTTSTYSLRGISTSGESEVAITINVSAPAEPAQPPAPEQPEPAPADTSGPNLGGLQLSTAKVFDNSACGTDNITITIKAQDAGGISKVELHYRARTESGTGTWRVKNMSASGGGNYSTQLSAPDFSASLANYTPGRVDVKVKAWDTAGNMSQSTQMSFETDYCLF